MATTTRSVRLKSRNGDEILRSSTVYREYLGGIDNLRHTINQLEQELVAIEKEYYQAGSKLGNYDEQAVLYLQNASNLLREAIQLAQDSRIVSVHSEMRLNNLSDRLRKLASRVTVSMDTKLPDSVAMEAEDPQTKSAALDMVSKLNEFSESQKFAIERIQMLLDKYEKTVLSKLQSNCLSFANAFGVREQKSVDAYTELVVHFLDQIQQEKQAVRYLSNSFSRGVRTQLCRETIRIGILLRKCDSKSFHVLLLVPNLTDKMETLLRVAREWLDREETFLFDLRKSIRETRSLALKTESALITEKEKQQKIMQAMKTAFLLCRNYRKQLEEVESELSKLKALADDFKAEKEAKRLDHDKKMEHIEFLQLNIGKTKMNFHIKMRKERLLKQLQALDESVTQLEAQISRVQNLMEAKSAEKSSFAVRVEENERDLSKLRSEFTQFTSKVNTLQGDLERLNDQLSAMQAIESFKTSADVVDNFFDRPPVMKLSPSLKRRIEQKKQFMRKSTSDLYAD